MDLLKSHAKQTQQAAAAVASNNAGLSVTNRLWLRNALVVEVQPGADLAPLAKADGVTEIIDNFEVSAPSPAESTGASPSDASAASTDYNTTYGPEAINATDVWSQYDTMGEGAKVAVLDTGVDGDHPAIEDSLEKFVAFDAQGNIETSGVENAYDSGGHGTHTSGIVVGDNSSGQYIGAAPEASLYHGLVLNGGSGSFAQIIAGMQWAVANDADVTSMSLGAPGYYDEFILPVQYSEAAGTVVVASIGNSGPDTSGSPGNVYETLSVGAVDANGDVASFSSGETVNKSDWTSPPSSWPSSYTVPDVVAPGVSVLSSSVDDQYDRISGTSMSAPYVAGAVALLEAAADNNPSVQLLENSLIETAKAPDSADPTRYGSGTIDVLAAANQVVSNTNVSVRASPQNFFEDYATPGENITATFRVSNLDGLNVTAVGNASNDGLTDTSNVSVYVNGDGPYNLSEDVTISPPAATDDFNVTVSVDEERATPKLSFEFSNSSTGTEMVGNHTLKVHPDPVVIDSTATPSEINETLQFAHPGTTAVLEDGTYQFDDPFVIPDGITVRSQSDDRASVTLNSSNATSVVLGAGSALSGVTVKGNASDANNAGVILGGDGASVSDVTVSETAFGVVALGTGGTVHNVSAPVTSDNTTITPVGVFMNYADDTMVSDVTVDAKHPNVRGIAAQWSSDITIVDTTVTVDGPDGVSTSAHAVELIDTSDTQIHDSELTSEAGSALMTAGASGTEVVSTPLSGSDVSAGATGTLMVLGGFYASTSDSTDALLDAVASEQTYTIAGQSVSMHTLQALPADEYRALAGLLNHSVAEEVDARLPDTDLAAVKEMNATERIAYANETMSDVTREDIEAIANATQDVGTHSHNAVTFKDASIAGGYAPVITAGADLELENATVTDSGYSKWGVYAVDSYVDVRDSVIDPTPGPSEVTYEVGVYSLDSWINFDGTTVSATTGVQSFQGGYVDAYQSTFKGQIGVTGTGFTYAYQSDFNTSEIGLADAFSDAYQSDFNSYKGILSEETYTQYSDFADTTIAIDVMDSWDSQATLNWFGDERGPSTFTETTDGASIDFGISYDPFLTKPLSEVTTEMGGIESEQPQTQAFATDLVMDPGQAYAFAVPGPTEGNLSQMFNEFNGVIYGFNAESQSWYQITPGNDKQLDALDALLVIPDSTARAVVEMEASSDPTKVPASHDMHEGWNFVGAPQYGSAETSFAASSADPARVVNVYEGPDSQPFYASDYWSVYTFGSQDGAPSVSAFKGYFVYAEENGTLASNVPEGVTVWEFGEAIEGERGIEPTFDLTIGLQEAT